MNVAAIRMTNPTLLKHGMLELYSLAFAVNALGCLGK